MLRFNYFKDSQYVLDELTGYTYHCTNQELVDLLNQLNNRADSISEELYKNKYKRCKKKRKKCLE